MGEVQPERGATTLLLCQGAPCGFVSELDFGRESKCDQRDIKDLRNTARWQSVKSTLTMTLRSKQSIQELSSQDIPRADPVGEMYRQTEQYSRLKFAIGVPV